MSNRPVVALIEQVLHVIRIPLKVSNIHIHCEQIAGHPIPRNTVKRELSRITNEESFKFSWIKRVNKGLYQYVPSEKPSVEDFNGNDEASISVMKIDDETASIKIKIPEKYKKIQLLIEKI